MAKKQDYNFIDKLPDKYLCSKCNGVLQEPHVTECCGQHYCESCLPKKPEKTQSPNRTSSRAGVRTSNQSWFKATSWDASLGVTGHGLPQDGAPCNTYTTLKPLRRGNIQRSTEYSCPYCGLANFNHIRYLPLKRKINDLKVYCPHHSQGCNQHIRFGDIETHVKECDYLAVWCTNKCGVSLLKKDLSVHCESNCFLRRVNCIYCWKVGTYVEICGSHISVCPDFPITCDNHCGQLEIKRKDVDEHKKACPLEPVPCPFAEAGCTEVVTRRGLTNHVSGNVQDHLSLLMISHMQLKEELKQRNNCPHCL